MQEDLSDPRDIELGRVFSRFDGKGGSTMKWSSRLLWFASIALAAAWTAGSTQADDREEMLKRYEQLKSNALQAMTAGKVERKQAFLKGMPDRKFDLVGYCDIPPADPVMPGQMPVRLG